MVPDRTRGRRCRICRNAWEQARRQRIALAKLAGLTTHPATPEAPELGANPQ
jgi:hypothetical protein